MFLKSSIATWVVVYGVGMQREICFLSFFLSCCEPVALLLGVYNFDVQQASKKAWYLHTDQDRPECVSELQQSTCWTLVTTCK